MFWVGLCRYPRHLGRRGGGATLLLTEPCCIAGRVDTYVEVNFLLVLNIFSDVKIPWD